MLIKCPTCEMENNQNASIEPDIENDTTPTVMLCGHCFAVHLMDGVEQVTPPPTIVREVMADPRTRATIAMLVVAPGPIRALQDQVRLDRGIGHE